MVWNSKVVGDGGIEVATAGVVIPIGALQYSSTNSRRTSSVACR